MDPPKLIPTCILSGSSLTMQIISEQPFTPPLCWTTVIDPPGTRFALGGANDVRQIASHVLSGRGLAWLLLVSNQRVIVQDSNNVKYEDL